MEAIYNLKRIRQPPNLEECLICQDRKNDRLINGGEQGVLTLKNVSQTRDKLCDTENRPTIDRIKEVSSTDANKLWWHKSCFSVFTSKTLIQRLQRKRQPIRPQSFEPSTSTTILRSSTASVNWDLCIFCQNPKVKGTMCSVTTFKMSDQILDLSKYDQRASVHLAGVSDLIAAEGKYHPNCFKRFQRNASKTKQSSEKSDLAIEWLVSELRESEKKGNVFQLPEVWNRYCELAEKADVEVPASFKSRRATFKEKLQVYVQDLYDFVTVPNKDVLLVPRKFGHIPFTDLVPEEEESCTIPTYQSPNDGFLEMVHVALKLRGEILAHPKYNGFAVSEDEMIACVPESLFMFIRLMFGGHNLLEGSPEDEEDITLDRQEADTQRRVLSVAQCDRWKTLDT